MKKTLIALFAGLLTLAAQGQGFDAAYTKTEPVLRWGEKMYNGAVRPIWTGEESFVFQTREPAGEAWYRVDGTQKTPIAEDVYKEALKNRRQGWYDPSDESQYAVKKEIKELSPDSSCVAYIRDNNVWVSQADGSGAVQLSFDGTDGNAYSELRWSPDGVRLAALKKEVLKERQILLRTSRPDDQVQPRYRWLDYAKPGDRLPQSTPALFDMEKQAQIPLCWGSGRRTAASSLSNTTSAATSCMNSAPWTPLPAMSAPWPRSRRIPLFTIMTSGATCSVTASGSFGFPSATTGATST